jgi:hypothetical protein
MGKVAREKREARAEEAASASKPSFLIDLSGRERIALIQFFRFVAPKAKGFDERLRRRNVRRALHVSDEHFAIVQQGAGAVISLGRYVDGGERFQPLKKSGRRLYELNEDRVGYLIDWLRDAEIPAELEDDITRIEERLRSIKARDYTPPDVPAAGVGELYAATPEQEESDDEDDTEDDDGE